MIFVMVIFTVYIAWLWYNVTHDKNTSTEDVVLHVIFLTPATTLLIFYWVALLWSILL